MSLSTSLSRLLQPYLILHKFLVTFLDYPQENVSLEECNDIAFLKEIGYMFLNDLDCLLDLLIFDKVDDLNFFIKQKFLVLVVILPIQLSLLFLSVELI